MSDSLDRLCISTIRFLSVDAVQSKQRPPGMPLGAAPMAYALWTRLLEVQSTQSGLGRSRTASCSAGHGSMLLYSPLHLSGYDLSLDDIRNFRQLEQGARPSERGHTPGVEVTTGPLGQGFANAVGMAMAEGSSRRATTAPITSSSTIARTPSSATAI